MKLRNVWLLVFSILFYAWADIRGIIVILITVFLNWAAGLWLARASDAHIRKSITGVCIVLNLLPLFLLKYASPFLQSTVGVEQSGFLNTVLFLPLGISFYTLHAISYLIDIYRKKVPAQSNIINTALYILLFVKVVQGPIMKYSEFASQLLARKTSLADVADGFCLFIIGLGKKILLSGNLAVIVSVAFSRPDAQLSVLFAWLGAYGYFLQMYYDFSGYSDMAIGIGRMFGFSMQRNFNYPYIATSVSEYWQRWHITLGQWFRDYLYYPLALGPAIKIRRRLPAACSRHTGQLVSSGFSLFIIWMCTGIWHGGTWNFVLWGMINFVFIFWEANRKPGSKSRFSAAIGWGYMILIAFITKPLVYTATLAQAGSYYGAMLGLTGNALWDANTLMYLRDYAVVLIAGSLLVFPIFEKPAKVLIGENRKVLRICVGIVGVAVMVAIFSLSVAYILQNGFSPFIYQRY
jgi:D-alanyl-lipoteichoic acid acyltransferase DltB (MBOAT superfamily)